MKTLTWDKSGEFKIKVLGDHHCGWAENGSVIVVRYHLKADCDVKSLDDRGFLFDQIGLDKFFKDLEKTEMSCEKLAMHCCGSVVDMIHKENPRCEFVRMEVSLSPYPFAASMMYSETYNTKQHK